MSFSTICIITAAGSSDRFGEQYKQFSLCEGAPLLAWSAKAFAESGAVDALLVVHPEGMEQHSREAVGNAAGELPVFYTAGGASRQDSVRLGLEYLASGPAPKHVLIHDGARPWITPACIREVLKACRRWGGALPVIPITDAVKQIDSQGRVTAHLLRPVTVGAQTPQAFEFPGILKAHRKAQGSQKAYIDDTEVYCDNGGTVHAVPGDPGNSKVTYPEDITRSRS